MSIPIRKAFVVLAGFLLIFILAVSRPPLYGDDFDQVMKDTIATEQKGDVNQALSIISRYIESNPNNSGGYIVRGNCYDIKNDQEKALADYDKAVELSPNDFTAYYDRASIYSRQAKYDLAISNFNKSIELNPNDGGAFYDLGAVYDKRGAEGDMDKAVESLKQAIELDRNDKFRRDDFKSETLIFKHNGISKALKDKLRALGYGQGFPEQTEEENLEDLDKKAYSFMQSNDYKSALNLYDKAIEKDPNNFRLYIGRGTAYKWKTDFPAAISDYSKALELVPTSSEAYMDRGNAYERNKQYNLSIADFTKAIGSNQTPILSYCYRERGIDYALREQEGDEDRAVDDLKQAIELDNKDSNIPQPFKTGVQIYKRPEVSQRIRDKLAALGYGPQEFQKMTDIQGMLEQAREDNRSGDYDQAMDLCAKVLAMDANNSQAYFIEGTTYFFKKDFTHAIENYEKVAQLDSKNIYVFYSLGACYRSLHDYEQAITNFTKAIENNPDNPNCYSDRAYCYVKRNAAGDSDLALADFQKAVTIDPASVQEVFGGWMSESISKDMKDKIQKMINDRQSQAKPQSSEDNTVVDKKKGVSSSPAAGPADVEPLLNEARSAYAKGDYDLTITDCDKVIGLKPDEWKAYFGRGNAYFAKKDYDQAITDYSKVIELKPDTPNAYSHRALSYVRQGAEGNNDKAMADFKKAVDMDPSSVQDILDGTMSVSQDLKDKIQQMVNEKKGGSNPRFNNPEAEHWFKEAMKDSQRQKNDLAIEDCNKALALEPNNPIIYEERAAAYERKGDYGKGIADLTKCIELQPGEWWLYSNRGGYYAARKDYGHIKVPGDCENAIADFTKAIELKPDDYWIYFERGDCYFKRGAEGDSDKALADFQKVMELDPTSDKSAVYGSMTPFGIQDLKDKIQKLVSEKKGQGNTQQ